MDQIVILLIISAVSLTGAEVPVQVVRGIESVNGSDVNGGCVGSLIVSDGVIVCGNSSGCSTSYLVDGNSPDIDTNTSDWASQLVTVKKNDAIARFITLTFRFDAALSLTSIELDLFLCPEWNISAPLISVYADNKTNLVYSPLSEFIVNFNTKENGQTSCNSLSTVTISVPKRTAYTSWYILVSPVFQADIDWVHVGEVRFLGTESTSPSMCSIEEPSVSLSPTSNTISQTHQSYVPSTTVVTMSTSRYINTAIYVSSTVDLSNSLTPSKYTLPTISPPPPPPPPANTSSVIPIIAAGVVGGLIVLVIAVGILFIILLIKKRCHSKTEPGKLQDIVHDPGTELKSMGQDNEYKAENPLYISSREDSTANGHQKTATESGLYDSVDRGRVDNPAYYSISPVVDSDLYTVVNDVKSVNLKAPTLADHSLYAAVDDTRYKSSTPPPTEISPVYSSVQKATAHTVLQEAPQLCADVNEAEATDLYSDTEAPAVPPKSPALQVYLATQDPVIPQPSSVNPSSKPLKVASLSHPMVGGMKENPNYESADAISSCSRNSHQSSDIDSNLYAQPYFHVTHHTTTSVDDEGIYSEPINPSDFHLGAKFAASFKGTGEEDSEPRIYSAVYTITTTAPEDVKQVLEVTSDNITEEKMLGTGQFGKVVLAHTNGLSFKDLRLSETDDDKGKSIHVAVKKLRSKHSKSQREAFDKEIKFMSHLQHPNVVRFIGVCYQNPAFIMMEYMKEGDLGQFLQRYSEIVTTPSSDTQIATSTVVQMALQIASGMKYLASQNFVHRDLASRNCLVGENFTVKLADFGMSRNLYESHYYRIQGNAILPIRWMATECFYGKFSEKTDVWAFGITMWELFTLAKDKPYSHLNDTEMVDDAVKGVHRQLLLRPAACPESVYKVMLQSWIINPKSRATFETLHEMMQKPARDYE